MICFLDCLDPTTMLTQKLTYQNHCSETWSVKSLSGEEYLIQIGFPRDWKSSSQGPIDVPVPIIYLTDGNSVFLTALEALHRRLSMCPPPFPTGVVVAIGYPISPDSNSVMCPRRTWDLTPPAANSSESEGGADMFLDFIENRVRPLLRRRLQETRRATAGQEALYGHSFGGLFALHALFTRPTMFNCFLASSPSIWWSNQFILSEEVIFSAPENDRGSKPSLMLFVGGQEQDPPRKRHEREKEYEKRSKRHYERRMVDNVLDMQNRLRLSRNLEFLAAKIYEGEDHGTVIACSISKGLAIFFENWPFEPSSY
ncbi:IroE protein [Colletotrichum truncatum]|uniref:IroE protein n=1 Tax=Colletotrichum truncatum TaxID=5467 RepID=A0ACC3Z7X1_COLTU|nr:IroE protein [Colletotrichum truncatum]KAF6783712.1 IroE protein [Colletotrichum truncatum]